MARVSTGAKVNLGLIAGGVIMVSVVAAAYVSGRDLVASGRMLDHTYQVIRTIQGVYVSVLTIESSARGYAVTHLPEMKGRYSTELPILEERLHRLRDLTLDNPGQQENVTALEASIAEKLDYVKRVVSSTDAGDTADAPLAIGEALESNAMVRIDAVLTELGTEEVRLLNARNRQTVSSGLRTLVVAGVGCLIGCMGAAFGAFSIHRDLKRRKQSEEELLKASREISDLYNHAPCGYHSLDEHGLFVRINDTELNWLGYTRDELVGKKGLRDLLTPNGVETFEREYPRFKVTGEVRGLEFDLICRDGSLLPVLLSATAVFSQDGRFVMSRTTVFDVTERKEAERALRQAHDELEDRVIRRTAELASANESLRLEMEERIRAEKAELESRENFRMLVGAVEDYAIFMLRPDGCFVSWNQGAELITGYSAEEMLGRHFSVLFSEQERLSGAPEEELQRASTDGKHEAEVIRVRKSGEAFWANVVTTALRTPTGEIRGYAKVLRDITEHKRYEATLRSSAQRHAVIAGLGELVLNESDASACLRIVCKRCSEGLPADLIAALNPASTPGTFTVAAGTVRTGRDLAGANVHDDVSEFRGRALSQGKPILIGGETMDSCPRFAEWLGEFEIQSAVCAPICGWHGSPGVLVFGSVSADGFNEADIDFALAVASLTTAALRRINQEDEIRSLNEGLEQRVALRTSDLEKANRRLEAFSYSVSHDLRVPLRGIDGFSRILMEDYGDSLDAEGKRLLRVIRDSTRHMGELIDDLLRFARLGRQEMRFKTIDMRRLFREVYDELRTAEGNRDVGFSLDPIPDAIGDESLVKLVVSNLLANALKFTRRKPAARIEVKGESNGQFVSFHVHDNGAGFNEAYSDKLFNVFQRLHSKEEFEGTGVGLALVHSIVERHGGRVWAEGAEGVGATFHFTLAKGAFYE